MHFPAYLQRQIYLETHSNTRENIFGLVVRVDSGVIFQF
jgi:hypothetical protein